MNKPTLYYTSIGQGEALLILHGLFGSSRNWQSLSKLLAEDFKVIAVDLRNHGDSFHDPQMNYQLMATDVDILMDRLDLQSAHVLGHSMGGKVAMTLCHRHPERIRKLIIADIAPITYFHDYDDLIEPILSMDLSRINKRKQADEWLSSAIPDQRIRLFLLQNLVIKQGMAMWKLNWPVLQQSMPKLTGFEDISSWRISASSLILRGALSDYVSESSWEQIQQHFNDVQMFTLQGAGHWLHAEQPECFYQAVINFIHHSA